jgi:hypothetical protein
MNLLVIFIGAVLSGFSALGLAWSRTGGKKPYDEIVGSSGVSLKVRTFQIRVAIFFVLGILILLAGFVAPPWP